MELLERGKVIEELKNSLTLIMDKYTKIKSELDKQKQYGIQLSANLRQSQKKKSRTISSYRTIANSTSTSFAPFSLFRITHFSHFFARCTLKKKVKVQIDDNDNVKKLKEELDNYKKEYEKKENSYISQINMISKKYEDMKLKNENLELNIKELIKNKNNEIEKEIKKRERILEEEKEKNKNDIDKLNKELEKLKEQNNLIKNENKNVNDIKNELETLKKKDKDNELKINELKMEIERLKKQSSLSFKLIKEENDELIKDINKLNETINLMKIKEKEYKEKEEELIKSLDNVKKLKEEEIKEKERQEKERLEKERLEKLRLEKERQEKEKYVINPSDNNYANINPNIDSQQPTILPQGVILIPIQNNELLQINENKKVYSDKPYSMCLAIVVLIVNIFFPGIGTIIGSCGINNPDYQTSFCCHGICELFLSFCIIGWCFALCHSCLFLSVAASGKCFEEYYETTKLGNI